MKRLFTALALSTLAFTAVHAAPYCQALGAKDQLPKKYQKRGPFYSDATTGWIIGHDQLRTNFALSDEAKSLLRRIKQEFASQGAELTVLAAPPRPLFASAAERAAMGVPTDYKDGAVAAAFSTYIAELNALGIQAPDLLPAALESKADYFFRRDTHWTPLGAAISASALAKILDGDASGGVAGLPPMESYTEKGSLSMVAEATCGARPEAEKVNAPVYTRKADADALLSEGRAPAIALVGTSFSDRYQRDAYRVADAIAHFTGDEVDNMSVTGGGLTSAMEILIRSGKMSSGAFRTVIWEAPYTAPLSDAGALRQVLGALFSQNAARAGTDRAEVSGEWSNIKPAFKLSEAIALDIQIPGVQAGQLDVELLDETGEKVRLKLRKSDRVAPALLGDTWSIALVDLPIGDVVRMKLRLRGANGTIDTRLTQITD